MKKETKEIIENIFLFIMSMILLTCGCIAKEQGFEGIGIFMIMGSLYLVMWIHAGIVGMIIERKIKNGQRD